TVVGRTCDALHGGITRPTDREQQSATGNFPDTHRAVFRRGCQSLAVVAERDGVDCADIVNLRHLPGRPCVRNTNSAHILGKLRRSPTQVACSVVPVAPDRQPSSVGAPVDTFQVAILGRFVVVDASGPQIVDPPTALLPSGGGADGDATAVGAI